MPAPSKNKKARARTSAAGKLPRSPGVRILLVGNDRTRLRATAAEMAAKLGRQLLPINLAAVISKYIGETEKNLDQILARAGATGVVLFLDEADALFGKRSEVKDSHDRYLNIEADYLIERMEAFGGLVILASSHQENLDPAFLRRLRVEIPLPTAPIRGPAKPENARRR
jgi:SpoVK/Ycf46/Vps4 family AAA+-type ATPase